MTLDWSLPGLEVGVGLAARGSASDERSLWREQFGAVAPKAPEGLGRDHLVVV